MTYWRIKREIKKARQAVFASAKNSVDSTIDDLVYGADIEVPAICARFIPVYSEQRLPEYDGRMLRGQIHGMRKPCELSCFLMKVLGDGGFYCGNDFFPLTTSAKSRFETALESLCSEMTTTI